MDAYSTEDEEGNNEETDLMDKFELANEDSNEDTIQSKSAVSQPEDDDQFSEERLLMEMLETSAKVGPIYDDAVEDDAVEDNQRDVANFVNNDDDRRILTDNDY